jgi:hypothetical protein
MRQRTAAETSHGPILNEASIFDKTERVVHLVRRYWAGLATAFVAVLGETFADVLEPWPIKVVVDSILQSKKLPHILEGFVTGFFGQNKMGILNFAVTAVAAIAVLGALSTYIEKYMTVTVSQSVAHDMKEHAQQPYSTAFPGRTGCHPHWRSDFPDHGRYRSSAR